jgi:hypothetical protein
MKPPSGTNRVTSGYSGTPLPKKLGIKEGSRVALISPPGDFLETLGELPPRVSISTKAPGESDVVVLFVSRSSKLSTGFARAMRLLPPGSGMLWVSWPKKAAKTDTDLDENVIRNHGLAAGMVDTKVCAVDEKWSGLRFNRRRTK